MRKTQRLSICSPKCLTGLPDQKESKDRLVPWCLSAGRQSARPRQVFCRSCMHCMSILFLHQQGLDTATPSGVRAGLGGLRMPADPERT
jgi:hypothetical protein